MAKNEQRELRRRWYQLSLRSLLILMVVIGIGLGWAGNRWNKKRQRTAVKVSGIVLLNGVALDSAIVTFSNRDIASSGMTDSTGKFALYIRPGRHNVTISKMKKPPASPLAAMSHGGMSTLPGPRVDPSQLNEEPEELIPSRYSSPEESALTFDVTFDGPNRASFRLVDKP